MDRSVTVAIKPGNVRMWALVKEVRKVVEREGLPSFSYVMLEALKEYMDKHYDVRL